MVPDADKIAIVAIATMKNAITIDAVLSWWPRGSCWLDIEGLPVSNKTRLSGSWFRGFNFSCATGRAGWGERSEVARDGRRPGRPDPVTLRGLHDRPRRFGEIRGAFFSGRSRGALRLFKAIS